MPPRRSAVVDRRCQQPRTSRHAGQWNACPTR
jgi:hypothetical protein